MTKLDGKLLESYKKKGDSYNQLFWSVFTQKEQIKK